MIDQSEKMPSIWDVHRAAARIAGDMHVTPVLTSETFNSETGCNTYFKAENIQRTGAFKIRGALNKIKSLNNEEKARGVITFSSGNHAQATALAARLSGIYCVVVMPTDARSSKRSAVEGYGAKVITAGTTSDHRLERAMELQKKHGYIVVPPYEDPLVIAGQGTCGLEIVDQVPDAEIVLIPVGGGGFISGCSLAIKSVRPDVQVVGVETEGADDACRSFHSGELIKYERTDTIADGMRNLSVGNLNFDIIMRYVDDMITVSDDEVIRMMGFFFERMKLVVEPTGAVAPAAIRVHSQRFRGKKVCAIISGGNIGMDDFFSLIK